MLTVLMQPNPVCGDFAANAGHLDHMAHSAWAALDTEAKNAKTLFLTPACALAGTPWQPLSTVDGFFARALRAAEYLAALLQTRSPDDRKDGQRDGQKAGQKAVQADDQADGGPRMLVSLPHTPGAGIPQFLLLHKGKALALDCGGDGLLRLPDCRLYLPEQTAGGKREYLRPHTPAMGSSSRPDAILLLDPLPFTSNSQIEREENGAALAKAWRIPLLALNQCGATDGMVYAGQSCAFSASGRLVGRAPAFEPACLLVDLDRARQDGYCAGIAPAPIRDEALFRAASLGVRDYVRKCGFRAVVIGLSGGMDSALAAAVAVDALGPEHVLAVLMPSPWSSDHSVADALALAGNLGIAHRIVPIDGMMTAFAAALDPVFAGFPPREGDLSAENVQARIRGVILMSFANRLGRIVIGTSNKSENAVGYCTLYGDTVGAVDPLGDIYKSDVYKLARWYNAMRGTDVIPENILKKAPSAELRPGQTDQDSLPPYEELDAILAALLEGGVNPAELALPGVDPGTVAKVVHLLSISEFKRQQCPPVLRFTRRALGADWRMPVAARALPPLDHMNRESFPAASAQAHSVRASAAGGGKRRQGKKTCPYSLDES